MRGVCDQSVGRGTSFCVCTRDKSSYSFLQNGMIAIFAVTIT